MKRVIAYFLQSKDQILKYVIVGGSGVFLDIGTLILFKEKLHWSATLAVAVNQIIVLGYNFCLNKYWAFQNREVPYTQIARYGLVFAGNYVFSILFMHSLHSILNLPYIWVRIANIAISVTWNFPLYKHWVYKQVKS